MERRAGGLRKNLAVVFGAVSGNKGRRRYVCFMMKCWNFFRAGDSVRGGVSRAGKVACAYSASGGLRALRVVDEQKLTYEQFKADILQWKDAHREEYRRFAQLAGFQYPL